MAGVEQQAVQPQQQAEGTPPRVKRVAPSTPSTDSGRVSSERQPQQKRAHAHPVMQHAVSVPELGSEEDRAAVLLGPRKGTGGPLVPLNI